MPLFLPYAVWCLSKSYAHTNNCKNKITCLKTLKKKQKRTEKKNTIAKSRD
jgi:hypothetical protein